MMDVDPKKTYDAGWNAALDEVIEQLFTWPHREGAIEAVRGLKK